MYSYANAFCLITLGIASCALFCAFGENDCTGCVMILILGIAEFIRVRGLRKNRRANR